MLLLMVFSHYEICIMSDIKKRIVQEFGNKLRVRVCGICVEGGQILTVNHRSLNESGEFWGPPGGGMDFAMSAEENLKREFEEETGIKVDIKKFLFVHEYLSPPLHAIELFFEVKKVNGKVLTGYDPEMKSNEQIIKDVRYKSIKELKEMDNGNVHQVFRNFNSLEQILEGNGYFLFRN